MHFNHPLFLLKKLNYSPIVVICCLLKDRFKFKTDFVTLFIFNGSLHMVTKDGIIYKNPNPSYREWEKLKEWSAKFENRDIRINYKILHLCNWNTGKINLEKLP